MAPRAKVGGVATGRMNYPRSTGESLSAPLEHMANQDGTGVIKDN